MYKCEEENIINLLIDLVNEELDAEKEYNNCADKENIKELIDAKVWLMKKKELMPIILNRVFEKDIEEYLNAK
jgi:hypothetical protein